MAVAASISNIYCKGEPFVYRFSSPGKKSCRNGMVVGWMNRKNENNRMKKKSMGKVAFEVDGLAGGLTDAWCD